MLHILVFADTFFTRTNNNREPTTGVVNQILEGDYPAIDDVTWPTKRKTRKMLMLLSETVPQKMNMSQLFRELETDRNQGLKMLTVLQRGGLVNLLNDDTKR